jgi:dihydropyrimidinase/dihydroorotase
VVVDTVIKNAQIVNIDSVRTGGIAINQGKIVAITNNSNLPKASKCIDAKGRYVIPGVIDPHVHYSLGRPYEEDCKSEARAAVAGGITTEALMTWGASPADIGSFKDKFEEAKTIVEKHALGDVVFIACLFTDEHIREMPEYAKDLGITQFKYCLFFRGADAEAFGLPSFNDTMLWKALETASSLDYPVISLVHAENIYIHYRLREKLKAEGRNDIGAWTESRPSICEAENTARCIMFADYLNAPLYIVHMSSKEAVDISAQAQAKGSNVYVETCPQYLSLSWKDFPKNYVQARVNPPIRDKEHSERLWWGIRNGFVHCIGTDHCAYVDKDKFDLWSTRSGLTGLETLLPVMLSEGVNKGRISMEKLVEVCSYNTAKILGIHPKKGSLSPGSDADLVIVDLKKKVKVSIEDMHTGADYTPFEGRELKGWPVLTMVKGNVVMEDGEITGKPGTGKYIPRKTSKTQTFKR